MNKKIKSILTLILVLALLLGASGCGNSDSNSNSSNNENKNEVLAKVGDSEITQSQVDGYVNYHVLTAYQQSAEGLTDDERNQISGLLLNFAVEVDLLKEYYEKKGETVLPEDFDGQFDTFKESLNGGQENQQEGQDMIAKLEEEGVNEDTLKFFYSSQFYTKKYMKEIEKENPLTDKEMKDYYNKNKDKFTTPAQIQASHILIGDESHKDEDLKTIKDVKKQIDSGDVKFEDMAKKYNRDSTKDTGGDLGSFGKGSMVKEFEDAAFALKKDEVSDPVKTQYGWHLIKLTGSNKEEQKSYNQAKDEVKALIEEDRYLAGIDSLKKEFPVEYTEAGQKLTTDSALGNNENEEQGESEDQEQK